MIKKILLATLVIVSCSFAAKAQQHYSSSNSCPKVYLGLSTGINNQTGLIGLNLDVPVTEYLSLGSGVGISSWGYKTYFEGRFYFKNDCNRGWAIGTGVTYNTGLEDFTTLMSTTTGEEDVTFDLNPTTNVFVSGYRFFNLGRGGSRFFLQLGYSINISNNNYTILSYHQLDDVGRTTMRLLTPGGIIIGCGFSFGIGK